MRYNKTNLNLCRKILQYYKFPEDMMIPSMKKHNEELSLIQKDLEKKVKRMEERNLRYTTLWK